MDSKYIKTSEMNKIMKTTGTVSVIVAFVLMCVLKLWFTMFIMLAFAIVLSIISKKANYCSHYCPMGFAMEACGSKNYPKKKPLRYKKYIRILFFFIFWGSVIYTIYNGKSIHDLWSGMLVIMLASGFSSIIMQEMFGKKFFCVNLCPYRVPFITSSVKIGKLLQRKR